MEWNITVDLTQLEDLESHLKRPAMKHLRAAFQNAAEYVRQTWGMAVTGTQLAGMTKPVNDEQYYESLYTSDAIHVHSPLAISVVTLYERALTIEEGKPAYDMKPAILAGPAARVGKNGRYNRIPFRWMTPQKGGGNRAHGQAMPLDIYTTVKQQGVYRDPAPRGGIQQGQRSKLAATININALTAGAPAPMAGNYTWRYGLFHGMRKYTKQYDKARQSTYWTFRTVSEDSDPSSWIHPGFPANPILDAVVDATAETVAQLVLAGAEMAFGR